jgi:hypothetical protein
MNQGVPIEEGFSVGDEKVIELEFTWSAITINAVGSHSNLLFIETCDSPAHVKRRSDKQEFATIKIILQNIF